MLKAATLAGFIAAHAVWSVSDGETLIPIYAYQDRLGERSIERIITDRLEEAVELGKNKLEANTADASAGVLIYDARIMISNEKIDSLIIEFRSYGEQPGNVTLAIPYTPKSEHSDFAVHRLKLVDASEHLEDEIVEILEAFFGGVDEHEKGALVWQQHLEESK